MIGARIIKGQGQLACWSCVDSRWEALNSKLFYLIQKWLTSPGRKANEDAGTQLLVLFERNRLAWNACKVRDVQHSSPRPGRCSLKKLLLRWNLLLGVAPRSGTYPKPVLV